MYKNKKETVLVIPSTYTGETRDRKLRPYKIGLIARAAATFSIDKIIVYFDRDPKFESHGLGRYIVKVLKYLVTPPYIRKLVFPLEKDLEYVGVCYPLNIPSHIPDELGIKYRYAYVLERKGNRVLVFDGKRKYWIELKNGYDKHSRLVIVDVERKITVKKEDVPYYFGYEVYYYNRELKFLLRELKEQDFFLIGTSKYGKDIRKIKIPKKDKVAVVFGSPFRGLKDIIGKDWEKYFDIVVNTVPNQCVKTVRTEEAIFYTLAILRYLDIV